MAKTRKASAADAELILKLYDLRRETEMRKARNWSFGFQPESAEDVLKVAYAFGTQENAWLRQVISYWETAAALVLNGALDQKLFFDTNGEMYGLYAKLRPFLKELREKTGFPELVGNIEKEILSNKQGRERVKQVEQRMAEWRRRQRATSAAAAD